MASVRRSSIHFRGLDLKKSRFASDMTVTHVKGPCRSSGRASAAMTRVASSRPLVQVMSPWVGWALRQAAEHGGAARVVQIQPEWPMGDSFSVIQSISK